MATGAELQDFYETALKVSREAGQRRSCCPDDYDELRCMISVLSAADLRLYSALQIALDGYSKLKVVETKECSADLVTESDKKVEEFVVSSLRSKFPTHHFIGEESSGEKKIEYTNEPTWMIDPIDGTSNFVHSFPHSAVCIGLAVNKTPVVGVVYNFIQDQMFSALVGKGAFMNNKPIHVSNCKEISKALVAAELGSVRTEELLKPKVETFYKLTSEPNPVHGLRSLGSAALDCCMVACGACDAYFEYGIHCWDIAAAELIVREAGGVTVYPTGEPLDVMKRGILAASTNDLATQLIPQISYISYPSDC